MSERSVIAYEHYREASQRFDYFVLGLSGALCVFIGQSLKPQKLGLSPYTLEVISLLLLAASVVAGFKLIENAILSQRLNHRLLDSNEKRGQLMANSRAGTLLNSQTGDVYSPEERAKQLALLEKEVPKLQQAMKIALKDAYTCYKVRNCLLGVGFLGLLVSKILTPYCP